MCARPPVHHPHPPPTQVIHGEIGENALESLAQVAQDIFVPMLTSPVNQQGWPDMVAKEVTENLHKFVSNGACMGCAVGSRHHRCRPTAFTAELLQHHPWPTADAHPPSRVPLPLQCW